MLETITLLCDYTRWADARMFDAVATLTPDQFTKDLGSSLKSVRDTVVHLASAQWIWMSRWKGTSPAAMWDPAEFPTPASVQEKSQAQAQERAGFLVEQTEASLAATVHYKNLKGVPQAYPLGQLLLHMTNHSTYHRGQVATLLRQLGAQPVSTDLVVYYNELAKKA